jgi:Amt family ammonium transporter
LSDEQREFVETSYESADSLLTIINDILDLSKIEAKKFDLSEERVSVEELVGSVTRFIAPKTQEKGLALETRIDDGLPDIYADRRALRQVLLNLLSNAVKFTPTGGHVSIAARPEPDGRLALIVTDTGIGMSRNDIPRAMEPFTQIESSLTNHAGGTGLGLPLTRSLVALHGGTMVLQSDPGAGTVVTVRLPWERLIDRESQLAG